MNNFNYFNWYNFEASKEEKQLSHKMGEFDELFKDMVFAPGSKTYNLLKCQTLNSENEEWYDTEIDIHEELMYFSSSSFRCVVKSLDDCGGYCDSAEKEICIPPESIEDDTVVLHEMIHMYESVLNFGVPMYYRDSLFWVLYNELKLKIPELDEIITNHAHILTEQDLYSRGGLHDVLFLLKSFDLDMRMDYSLGTVFSYGRKENFKNYTYQK